MNTQLPIRLILLSTLLVLPSCSWIFGSDDEPEVEPEPEQEAQELASTVKFAEMPEQELFRKGKLLYQAGSYLLAQDAFRSLRDGYPSGPYTEFAEIKIADCLFLGKQYEEAAISYEDLVKSRPSSSVLPYALFQLGRSYQFLNKGVGRDREPLEKAAQYFDRLIQKHPNSPYTQTAKHYKKKTFKRLAYHEQKVLDFYKDQGADAAYASRKQEFDKKWSGYIDTTENEQAPEESDEVITTRPKAEVGSAPQNVTVTSPQVALATTSVVSANVITSAVRTPSVQTPKEELSIAPKEEPQVRIIPAAEPVKKQSVRIIERTPEQEKTTYTGRIYRIREVRCDTRNGKKVSINIDRNFEDENYLAENKSHSPRDGILALSLPLSFETDITVNCFEENDLKLTKNGGIELKTEDEGTLLAADNPPRLLIFLDN